MASECAACSVKLLCIQTISWLLSIFCCSVGNFFLNFCLCVRWCLCCDYNCDSTTIRLQRIEGKKWTCHVFRCIRIVVESQLWYRLYSVRYWYIVVGSFNFFLFLQSGSWNAVLLVRFTEQVYDCKCVNNSCRARIFYVTLPCHDYSEPGSTILVLLMHSVLQS